MERARRVDARAAVLAHPVGRALVHVLAAVRAGEALRAPAREPVDEVRARGVVFAHRVPERVHAVVDVRLAPVARVAGEARAREALQKKRTLSRTLLASHFSLSEILY